MSEKFFNPQSVLSTPDKNGELPELYIVVSRGRGLGKTFAFTKVLLDRFSKDGGKFVLFCRYGKELGGIADGMFKGMLEVEHPGAWMTEKQRMHGVFSDIYLCRNVGDEESPEVDKQHCGYVIPLNAADSIKKVSSTFTDAVHALFDEFQPENRSTYITDEVEKFKSIHTSIARGGGSSRRYFPVYLSSNAVSISNPYFMAMRLHRQIQRDTKKFRGDGFVYQRVENSDISSRQDSSPMSRAFPDLNSSNYSDEGWFADDNSGVCTPNSTWGPSSYCATIVDGEKKFGLRWYEQSGIWFLGHSTDETHPRVLRITVDGAPNLPMLRGSPTGVQLRSAILVGQARYQSQGAKTAALEFMV